MSTVTGKVESIGNIDNYKDITDTLRNQLESKSMPVIQCRKSVCRCGFCAPKSETRDGLLKLIRRHVPENVFEQIESCENKN